MLEWLLMCSMHTNEAFAKRKYITGDSNHKTLSQKCWEKDANKSTIQF